MASSAVTTADTEGEAATVRRRTIAPQRPSRPSVHADEHRITRHRRRTGRHSRRDRQGSRGNGRRRLRRRPDDRSSGSSKRNQAVRSTSSIAPAAMRAARVCVAVKDMVRISIVPIVMARPSGVSIWEKRPGHLMSSIHRT